MPNCSVCPLLTHWRYCNLARCQWNVLAEIYHGTAQIQSQISKQSALDITSLCMGKWQKYCPCWATWFAFFMGTTWQSIEFPHLSDLRHSLEWTAWIIANIRDTNKIIICNKSLQCYIQQSSSVCTAPHCLKVTTYAPLFRPPLFRISGKFV